MLHTDLGGGFGTKGCFVNPGAMAVNIGGVYRFDTGDNKAIVNYERGGRYYSETLDKWWDLVTGD